MCVKLLGYELLRGSTNSVLKIKSILKVMLSNVYILNCCVNVGRYWHVFILIILLKMLFWH